MRQGPNPKRSRGRNNNNNNNGGGGRRPNVPLRMQTFDSNGPDVRIRGSAFQVHEKYLQLARDASSSGDRIIAENYLQHAEHYYRIIAAAQEQQAQQQANDPNRRFRPEGYNGQDFRGGQSDEEGGDVLDGFPTDEQIEGQQPPRGDNYRQDGRQQDAGRQHDDRRNDGRQQDGRQHDGRQHDGRQYDGRGPDGRGQDGRGRDNRHQQQDPAYRPQPEMQYRGDGAQPEGNYRPDPDQQYRQSPEGDGNQHYEERPRIRTFDDRQGGHGNGHADGDHQPNGEHVPVTPVQIEFPQPVTADAAPEEAPAEEAAPPVRRGRPRRPRVEATEPAEG
ncbi:MAG TPA: DUF4167 domain-containing protein [Alphaproteobacteria bacterium]|nr:DUF4167 domain-containing protein [Alphaproteobacteria bacterium]